MIGHTIYFAITSSFQTQYSHEYSQEGERRRNSANVHGHRARRPEPQTPIESTTFNP